MNKNIKAIQLAAVNCTLLVVLLISSCGKKKEQTVVTQTGTIVFAANGEDFVRKGFVDKQGWHISFDKLFVNIVDPTAYMPSGEKYEANLAGEYWIDLAQGDENAEPITVGALENVKAANYQSLKFSLKRRSSGEYKGYSIVMIGTAEKEGTTVPFTIQCDEEMDFNGKEGYVGDEIKGMVKPGDTASVEMTFHFDHIFGDKEAPEDDHVNTGSVGFDFFDKFRKDGKVICSQSEMKSADGYATLVKAIWTLGHLGEGHCAVSNQSSSEEIK